MLEISRGLFQYNEWANRRVIDSLKRSSGGSHRALRYFAHILMAEKGWLLRMQGTDTFGLDFWPYLTLDACEQLAQENHQNYVEFFASLSENDLDLTTSYRNSQGVEYHTKFRDVLIHVAFHGAYHRGQIAAALRADGTEPAYTDYIGFEREVGGLPSV